MCKKKVHSDRDRQAGRDRRRVHILINSLKENKTPSMEREGGGRGKGGGTGER